MSFSILILTLNEEQNLPDCLASVAWCDDVVILDSGSTDRTCEVARAAGARVFTRAFDDFASQRNWALDHIPFTHPFLFHLDADERFTPELLAECRQVVAEDRHSGYLVANKLMFMGRWIRRASQFPCYQMRLLKRGEIVFERNGHGQREGRAERGLGRLREAYLHYNFSKGLADWIEKHNRYSSQEADESANLDASARLFARDPHERRKALKRLATRLPCQPLLRFLYLYLARGGCLDGTAGYHYCRLVAIYQYFIHLKRREHRENWNHRGVRP